MTNSNNDNLDSKESKQKEPKVGYEIRFSSQGLFFYILNLGTGKVVGLRTYNSKEDAEKELGLISRRDEMSMSKIKGI
jgi:hypothetical protein